MALEEEKEVRTAHLELEGVVMKDEPKCRVGLTSFVMHAKNRLVRLGIWSKIVCHRARLFRLGYKDDHHQWGSLIPCTDFATSLIILLNGVLSYTYVRIFKTKILSTYYLSIYPDNKKTFT